MNQQIKQFLEFEGKTLLFVSNDGTFWVAIKPICELLNVDHSAQLKSIKKDPILRSAWSVQTIQVPNDQLRNMVCMAEKYIYGWIFNIQSNSPDLINYKWKIYDILFNYFQGSITHRNQLIKEKSMAQLEIEQIEVELSADPKYTRLVELKKNLRHKGVQLKRLDDQFAQLVLFS